MSPRREILFLAHRIPYPPDKGDKIRAWRFLERFARRFDVHLAAFIDDPRDRAHEAHLKSLCASVTLARLDPTAARMRSAASLLKGEPLTFGYFRDGGLSAAVQRLRSRPLALEYAFSSSTAPYLEPAVQGRPRIADICDADSEKWLDYALSRRGLMRMVYRREFARLAACETDIINRFDAALAISAAEGSVLMGRPGVRRPVLTIGNGVDVAYFGGGAGDGAPADAGDVAFVGAMDYRPNIDAAIWFLDHVWPAVRAARPGARFSIVGARPARRLKVRAGAHGVCVTGRVADVRPYLHSAKAVVAPLMIARGVQNKVLEAMAAGRPIVATSAANIGIEAAPGSEILIANEAVGFAAAVIGLLERPQEAAALGAAARTRAIRDFGWDAQLARLDSLVDRLLAPGEGDYSGAGASGSGSVNVATPSRGLRSTENEKTSGRE